MTTTQFRRWLQAEIRWLQGHEEADEQIFYDAAGILDEARQKAAAFGLPEIAKLCRCRARAVAPITAQESLSAALAALPNAGNSTLFPRLTSYGSDTSKAKG